MILSPRARQFTKNVFAEVVNIGFGERFTLEWRFGMFYSLYAMLGQNMWFTDSPKMDFEDAAWDRLLDM